MKPENSSAARAVFITGGGSGLGAAVARRLVASGWRVAIAGRRAQPLQALAVELGERVTTVVLDVADAPAVEAAIREFRPDSLLCSAAVLGRGDIWSELTPARFVEVLSIDRY